MNIDDCNASSLGGTGDAAQQNVLNGSETLMKIDDRNMSSLEGTGDATHGNVLKLTKITN